MFPAATINTSLEDYILTFLNRSGILHSPQPEDDGGSSMATPVKLSGKPDLWDDVEWPARIVTVLLLAGLVYLYSQHPL